MGKECTVFWLATTMHRDETSEVFFSEFSQNLSVMHDWMSHGFPLTDICLWGKHMWQDVAADKACFSHYFWVIVSRSCRAWPVLSFRFVIQFFLWPPWSLHEQTKTAFIACRGSWCPTSVLNTKLLVFMFSIWGWKQSSQVLVLKCLNPSLHLHKQESTFPICKAGSVIWRTFTDCTL